MVEREVAWRVFAHEFIHSDYFFHDGDERSPNYLVTPTGARVNRLYFVGVLTEIDNLGTGEDMWRARVSDPTGAFSVYAGQYQPQASVFLSGLDVPCFVAITGKARTYEPEDGTVYTSVRPEELNTASDSIRDRWIVDTARLTYERIILVRSGLDSGLKGSELTAMLIQSGASAELADGILRAVSHYTDLEKYLNTLSDVIVDVLKNLEPVDHLPAHRTGISHAIEEVAGSRLVDAMVKETPALYSIEDTQPTQPGQSPQPETARLKEEALDEGTISIEPAGPEENKPEPDEIVYELMSIMDKGSGVPVTELVDESKRSGLTEKQVNDGVKILMSEGRCYEPRIGVLRRV